MCVKVSIQLKYQHFIHYSIILVESWSYTNDHGSDTVTLSDTCIQKRHIAHDMHNCSLKEIDLWPATQMTKQSGERLMRAYV